ncbi:hypothetical protein CBS101457_001758 [Exobasidium rhododendri]|nr:hypothetical protein CBS101457_001758 [Exobasidium rhododendri]
MDGDGGEEERKILAERKEVALWKKLRTGARSAYDSIARDSRGYPIFVRASQVSKDWQQPRDAERSAEDETVTVESDGEAEDDIFPSQSTTRNGSLHADYNVEASSSSLVMSDAERGKVVASFYSRLPRDASNAEAALVQRERGFFESAPARTIPRMVRSIKGSGTEWFIEKANAHLQRQESNKKDRLVISSLPPDSAEATATYRCEVCSAVFPRNLTSSQLNAHRLSIAHQLALEGPAVMFTDQNLLKKRRLGDADIDHGSGRIVLKSSNIGYTALERMGWRRGMGLGRTEWELGLQSAKATLGLERRETVAGVKEDAIVISDSDEEESDRDVTIGSDEWLVSVQAQHDLHVPREQSTEFPTADERPKPEKEDVAEESLPPAQRPLLEPIAIHKRPDRRGIGTLFTTIPRNGRHNSYMEKIESKSTEPQPRPEKLSKKERKEFENQRRREWKELRMSLN